MEAAIDNDEFIEHATFAGNMYGTSKQAVKTVMNQGNVDDNHWSLKHLFDSGLICILDIDVQGVKSMKKTDFNSNYVFISPPSMSVLEQRLRSRGTETQESLETRLKLAVTDLDYGNEEGNFDIVIVNDHLEKAYLELEKFLKEKYPSLLRKVEKI